jgi:RNA polymerase sigma-70 factor (ECF subfamily)
MALGVTDHGMEAAPGKSGPMMGLARAAAQGDGIATGQLLRALAPRLGRIVRAVLGGNHPDLDDAVQQSLIGLVQALPAFRGDCEPLGYATIIAVRTAVATRKRSRTDQSRRGEPIEADLTEDSSPSPGEEAVSNRRRELLRGLLDDLPTEQAEALAMRVVLGWSIKEIAIHSGAPQNTVRSRLRLAKEALKSRIEQDSELVDLLAVAP